MTNHSLKLSIALCAVAASICTPSFAQEQPNWYMGAGIGYAQNKIAGTPLGKNTTEKTHGTGFKIYGGYQFTKNFATELEYIDFGKYQINNSKYNFHGSIKTRGIGISALGILPLTSEFSLFGKLGIMAKFTDTQLRATGPGYNQRSSSKETKTIPLIGFGAEYRLTTNLALRAEYNYLFKTKLGDSNEKMSNSLASVGLRYNF